MPMPSTAPASESITASEKIGIITRSRLAPNADRRAASLVRVAARASSRLATLAHAMRSTKIVATCMAPNTAFSSGPVSFSTKVTNTVPTPSLLSGYSWASRRAIIANSSCACSTVTPSLSRPNTVIDGPVPRVGF